MKILAPIITFSVILSLFPVKASAIDRLYADKTAQQYRTGKIDPRISAVPADLQKNVFTDPKTNLPRLTAFLVKEASSDYLKAKRIHDWITDNFAYDMDLFYGLSNDGSRQVIFIY